MLKDKMSTQCLQTNRRNKCWHMRLEAIHNVSFQYMIQKCELPVATYARMGKVFELFVHIKAGLFNGIQNNHPKKH